MVNKINIRVTTENNMAAFKTRQSFELCCLYSSINPR